MGRQVSAETPNAVLELLKNNWILLFFEALDPSDKANDTKKRVKWLTLMQVKSRRHQERRHQKTAACSEKKPSTIDQRGLKTMILQKYSFHIVRLVFP